MTAGVCNQCGAPLANSEIACRACGARRVRLCTCGTRLPVGATACPNCGTALTKVTRRSKRRSRSNQVRRSQLIRSALKGAGMAIVGSLLLSLVISALAQLRGDETGASASLMGRLQEAGMTLGAGLLALWRLLCSLPVVPLLVMGLAGAGAGVLYHLGQTNNLRLIKHDQRETRKHAQHRRQGPV